MCCAVLQALGFACERLPDSLLGEEYQGGVYEVLRLALREAVCLPELMGSPGPTAHTKWRMGVQRYFSTA